MNERLDWVVDKRNHLFLGMCLSVHCVLLVIFLLLGIWGMVALNAFSIAFYGVTMFVRKNYSSQAIVESYFEIIVFAALSTMMLGRQAGFRLYIVGMISVVFYLAYDDGIKRFFYQGLGCVIMIILVAIEPYTEHICAEYKVMIAPHATKWMYMMNMIITLVTVIIVSYLYACELDRMNREIIDMNRELDYKASHDQLTGLINRHSMANFMDEISERINRKPVVCMMDVDDFKQLNDKYGHDFGDRVLQMIADNARECLKAFHVARWGGEEFLMVSEDMQWSRALQYVTEFHQQVQKQSIPVGDKELSVHVTIGMVQGDSAGNVSHLILEADNLLYIGKNSTKNCIVTYDNMKAYQK